MGRAAHAGPETVGDTGGIGDEQRGARIGCSLGDCLDGLIEVSPHGNLGHIHGSVGHGHGRQVLFRRFLAAGDKFCGRAQRGCLGSLTAGVGVNFRVQYQNIDIFPAGQYVVQTAETDIIGPSVSADDPLDGVSVLLWLSRRDAAPGGGFLRHQHAVAEFRGVLEEGV